MTQEDICKCFTIFYIASGIVCVFLLVYIRFVQFVDSFQELYQNNFDWVGYRFTFIDTIFLVGSGLAMVQVISACVSAKMFKKRIKKYKEKHSLKLQDLLNQNIDDIDKVSGTTTNNNKNNAGINMNTSKNTDENIAHEIHVLQLEKVKSNSMSPRGYV